MNFQELFDLDNLITVYNSLEPAEEMLLILSLFTGLISILALIKSSKKQESQASSNLISSIEELKSKLNDLSSHNEKFSKDVVQSIESTQDRIDRLESELVKSAGISPGSSSGTFSEAQKKKA